MVFFKISMNLSLRWIMGIQTVNLGIGILGSGPCRRTDPSVCADNQDMIFERNTATSEVRDHMRGLVVFRQLGSVLKVDNVGINGGPSHFTLKLRGCKVGRGDPSPTLNVEGLNSSQ